MDPNIAQQLHEIATALGKVAGSILLLAIIVGFTDFSRSKLSVSLSLPWVVEEWFKRGKDRL